MSPWARSRPCSSIAATSARIPQVSPTPSRSDGDVMPENSNPFAAQFADFGKQQQQSPMPAPNMGLAGKPPTANPSPFPSSGFQKQGMMSQQPFMPKLFDE